jgi:predicted pyridoxine 5'-phosphate oxidase superfamily flavin-nucleotide-binding protein
VDRYLAEMLTPTVLEAERRAYGRAYERPGSRETDVLGEDERAFIAARDSFYVATVSETGWPYVQHRGGPRGFLRVLDERHLAYADLRGNRQLLSVGHLASNDRVALLLMDYPQRLRLKVIGHARVIDPSEDPALAGALASPTGRVERLVRIEVVGVDWNCPAFITPRYTAEEVEEAIAPMRRRIAELEGALAKAGR